MAAGCGRACPGRPSINGENLEHTPLRLSVLIEAPEEAISRILDAHPEVKELFTNRWLYLFTLQNGHIAKRYRTDGAWQEEQATKLAA